MLASPPRPVGELGPVLDAVVPTASSVEESIRGRARRVNSRYNRPPDEDTTMYGVPSRPPASGAPARRRGEGLSTMGPQTIMARCHTFPKRGQRMPRHRRIHLINPKADTFATRPLFFGKALYSPVAGLLTVAAQIPADEYEVILTDENIEPIDFDIQVDMVGISAMTSYVKRGYEIADTFRARGTPVIMGGVHVSYMPQEALKHADAVVVGEAELLMPRILDDLENGRLAGIYKAEHLHSMVGMPRPRQSLLKSNRYINNGFMHPSRGCHPGCLFGAEPTMYGLKFPYRPVDELVAEIEQLDERVILLNDADFFGTPKRAMEVMKAFKGRGLKWQAAVNSREAHDERLLELAAESGCFMLSIGFESISLETLRNVHKCQNNPDDYRGLVEKLHRYGIMVLGLFIFGFEGDTPSVFGKTLE